MVLFQYHDFDLLEQAREGGMADSFEDFSNFLFSTNVAQEIVDCYKLIFSCKTWEEAELKLLEQFPPQENKKEPKETFSPVPVISIPSQNDSKDLITLSQVTVVVHCFNSKLLLEKMKQLEAKSYQRGLLSKYIRYFLQEELQLDGSHFTYSIIEPQVSSDAFGLYRYDPFYGRMKLVLQVDNSASKPLPRRFKLAKNGTVNVIFKSSATSKEFVIPVKNSILGFVEYILRNNGKPLSLAPEWATTLKESGVYSITELADWRKEHWEKCRLPVEAQRVMFRDIHSYCDLVRQQKLRGEEEVVNEKKEQISLAEEKAAVHNIERYFQYHAGDGNKDRGFLEQSAVRVGFAAMKKMTDIPTGQLLDDLERTMLELCYVNLNNHLKSPFLGLLLYGPPGTGKTRLCTKLSKLCGFTPVNSPIASTDANRPHVGETEEALRAIFNRAKLMPHVLHCLAIDEIDGLTQKRSQKVSEHAISTMSELLALVGGIKEVPNLLLMGSTNRPHMMDDAMLRRLPRKFFVGRPSSDLRKQAFDRLSSVYNIPFDFKALETLLLVTTNYHGAALQSICSQIRYFDRTLQESSLQKNRIRPITEKEIVEICSRVSNSYEIKIGPFIVADIFQDKPAFIGFSEVLKETKIPIEDFTGRIIVDLSDNQEGNFQVECKNRKVLHSSFPAEGFPFASQLVPTYVRFGIERKLEMIQYIDSEVLTSNAAFDDQTIQELLQEYLMEMKGYQKSMLVLDMDSLLGISCSHSHSSMGLSTSYSFSKQNLAAWLFSTSKSAMQMGPRGIEHWVVIVIGNSFCLESFKQMARFPKSSKERRIEKQQEVDSTEPIKCTRCRNYFLRSDNKPLDCSYHRIPADILDTNFDPDSFRYLCCGERYSPSSKNGCIQGPHEEM